MSYSQQSVPAAIALSGRRIALLGLVSAIGPVSTDMYLPAFPALEHDLGHGPGSAQITLTTWFVGLAIGQFSMGPICDRFGRRTPLLVGLVVYGIACAIAALTTSFELFCFLRFAAALGGSAATVAPRAIVRDTATGHEGARIMAQLTLVFGVGPILAPSLGGLLLQFGNWRLIFWAGTIFAALMLPWCWRDLPDTLPPQMRRELRPVAILARYIGLFREPVFMSTATLSSFSTFTMFAYLGSAPILFERMLGFSPRGFAVFFGLNAAGYILGTQISGRLARKVGLARLMERGIASAMTGAGLLALTCATGLLTSQTPWPICALIMWTTASLGFVGSNATVLALTHHGHQAGSASALLGTLAFSIGGSASILMAYLPAHWLSATGIGMGVGTLGMALCDVWWRHARKTISDGHAN